MTFGEYLTKKTNYLMDFTKPGTLFFSNHRYSQKEKMDRLFVVLSTATVGFLAWWKDYEATGIISSAVTAFLISHTITMSPLIYKRVVAQWNCYVLKNEITKRVSTENSDLRELVLSTIEKVKEHVSSKSPSAIWGKRQRLLETLAEWVDKNEPGLKQRLQDNDVVNLLSSNSAVDALYALQDEKPSSPSAKMR